MIGGRGGRAKKSGGPPVFAASQTYTAVAATSHAVTLPAGISAGDTLVMFFHTPTAVVTTPTGWALETSSGVTNTVTYVYTRQCDGSEGSTVTISHNSATVAVVTYLLTNGGASKAESATANSAGSTSIDPPSVTYSGGATSNVFLVSYHCYEATGSPYSTFGDANYTKTGVITQGNTHIITGYYAAAAATDNPDAATLSRSVPWVGTTVVVPPS